MDTAHALVTPEMTREALYVASTRARTQTHWYTTTEQLLDANSDHEPDPPRTAHEVLAGVLARTGAEDSATCTIRTTLTEATSLHVLVARYDHARQLAAREALDVTASAALPDTLARRILDDPASGRLADVLADAASRGAVPAQVLRNALAFDDIPNVRSPAAVLATRILDYGPTLGISRHEPAGRPLPWLGSPDVGHPGWRDYLQHRADLITRRAHELGGLAGAYREQYQLTHLPEGHLGEEPDRDTQRHHAFQLATRSQVTQQAPAAKQQTAVRRSDPDPRVAVA